MKQAARGERVVAAMSGGVDSAVTALLLKEQGYEVVGVNMKIWDPPDGAGPAVTGGKTCCSIEDVTDARRAAEKIGIPFYVVNLKEKFEEGVIRDFVAEYENARTPNPCVLCNSVLKFDELLGYAKKIGAKYVATGHYARIREADGPAGGRRVCRGVDAEKDQSYFLFDIRKAALDSILFPLGGMKKTEVRLAAERFGLHLAKKQESQEICFIPDNDYRGFLESRLGHGFARKGDIVHVDGTILGRHEGLPFYTYGQRRGLGIGHTSRLYVVGLDRAGNRVIVGGKRDLERSEFDVERVNWFATPVPEAGFEALIQIRHRHKPVPGKVFPASNGAGARVALRRGEPGITPGQCAVFYIGDCIAGGGWIADF